MLVSNPNTKSSILTLILSLNALYSNQNAILTQSLTLNLDSTKKTLLRTTRNSHITLSLNVLVSNPNTKSSILTLTLSLNALYSKQNAILTVSLTLNLDSTKKTLLLTITNSHHNSNPKCARF